MQRKLKRIVKTTSSRIDAVMRDIHALSELFPTVRKCNFNEYEMHIAHFAMLEHVKRIERKIKDLIKRNNLDEKKDAATELAGEAGKTIAKAREQLTALSEHINSFLAIKSAADAKADAKKIMVTGAGPVGYRAAIEFLKRHSEHECDVVLVSDKYADVPMLNGRANDKAFLRYFTSLGLENRALFNFIFLRPQGFVSIKHMAMLGRAAYLALGGKIHHGTIDWNEIKADDDSFPTVMVTSQSADAKKTPVTNVRCVLNVMGANASYPQDIERKDLEVDEAKKLLRTDCAQVNLNVSQQFMTNLRKLNNYYEAKKNNMLLIVEGKKDKRHLIKTQIYPLLTEKESKKLDHAVEKIFPEILQQEQNEEQRKEYKIVLKTLLFIEFLGDKAQVNVKAESPVFLRDQIKLGKHLYSKFKVHQPWAPPQKIVQLPGTKAVATWCGAAALPMIVSGDFIAHAVEHAKAVIDCLIKNKFTPEDLSKTPAGGKYQAWINYVNKFIEREHANDPDLSENMQKFLFDKYGVVEAKEDEKSVELPSQVRASRTLFRYPIANQSNMSVVSKMDIECENTDEEKQTGTWLDSPRKRS